MIFRQAIPEDFAAVMAIIEDGRATLAKLGIDQWQGGSPNASMIRSDIAAGYTMVAVAEGDNAQRVGASTFHEGEVVGTLAFVDTGEPDYDRVTCGSWLTTSPNSAEVAHATNQSVGYATLHRLAVSAKATRCGVASFMVRSAMTLAKTRGLASVRTDTHEGNGPMQRTFEKCGMKRCCEVELSNTLEPTKKRIGYEVLL